MTEEKNEERVLKDNIYIYINIQVKHLSVFKIIQQEKTQLPPALTAGNQPQKKQQNLMNRVTYQNDTINQPNTSFGFCLSVKMLKANLSSKLPTRFLSTICWRSWFYTNPTLFMLSVYKIVVRIIWDKLGHNL